MNQELLNIPMTLSFLTTYKCTASCKNCCFQCSSDNDVFLSLTEMKDYLNQSIEILGEQLKVLVLTGGEPFLLKSNLNNIIKYAAQKNIPVRIVSNGFWAKSYETAYKSLLKLKESGLKEINFSTGDEHLEWVPYMNIINGALAAIDLGITCAINVETHNNTTFSIESLLANEKIAEHYTKGRLIIIKGLWISFSDKNGFAHDNLLIDDSSLDSGCPSIFNTIAINPYSEMLSCCGLISEYVPFFRLGNLKKYNVQTLHSKRFQDLLKIWLYVDGPKKILEYIYKKRDVMSTISGHKCNICAEIFKDKKNIDCINEHFYEIMPSVLFKYKLLTK